MQTGASALLLVATGASAHALQMVHRLIYEHSHDYINYLYCSLLFFVILVYVVPSEDPTISPNAIETTAWPTSANSSINYFNMTETPTAAPTESSSKAPTEPTLLPSQIPSTNYVITVDTPLHVPYYSTSNTNFATSNSVPYTFTVCSAGDIHIADCDPNRCNYDGNDQYIRLYSSGEQVAANDDYCYYCSVIDYSIVSGTCQTYTLQQGCFGNTQCSGSFTITLAAVGVPQTNGNTVISYFNLSTSHFIVYY